MYYFKLCFIFFLLPLLAESTDEHILQDEEIAPPAIEDTSMIDVHKTTLSYETAFIKMMGVLVAILVLVFLTIWILKRFSQGRLLNANYFKSIKILERRPLSPKSTLYLIEIEGKQVLISESQLEVRTLTTSHRLKEET